MVSIYREFLPHVKKVGSWRTPGSGKSLDYIAGKLSRILSGQPGPRRPLGMT